MKKIIIGFLILFLLAACEKSSSTSSSWDNTSWFFTGNISASTDYDPDDTYSVSFPDGFSLAIENVFRNKYTSDFFTGDIEELEDGSLRIYITLNSTQTLEMDGFTTTYKQSVTQETTFKRIDDQHATGYFAQDQTTEVDGEKITAHFSGILSGTRTE